MTQIRERKSNPGPLKMLAVVTTTVCLLHVSKNHALVLSVANPDAPLWRDVVPMNANLMSFAATKAAACVFQWVGAAQQRNVNLVVRKHAILERSVVTPIVGFVGHQEDLVRISAMIQIVPTES